MKMSYATCRVLACASLCLAAAAPALSAFADGNTNPNPHSLYNKVVIVIEENQSYSTIIGNPAAPYTNSLANHGALFTTSYGTEHPSQPNYLDLFTGSDQNVSDDNFVTNVPFSTENLGAQLLHAGYTFAGYSEDLPTVGDTTSNFAAAPGDPVGTHDYARKHNPWALYQNDAFPASPANYGSNYLPSSVNQTLAPFTALSAAGDFAHLPSLSIVVPNQQHDDHGVTGGASGDQLISDGDTWLKNNIDAYAQWAKTHNSLLIVTWDEDDYSSINQIPTIAYGAHIRTGKYSEPHSTTFVSVVNGDGQPSGTPVYLPVQGINHWNILRTVEDIFHLGHIGEANKVQSITDVYKP